MTLLIVLSSLVWLLILLLPWKPWCTQEQLDSSNAAKDADLSDVTVLIPARNEASGIGRTLAALKQQGKDLTVVLVDDQSSDGTAETAKENFGDGLRIVNGKELPQGWVGKLWALEQGRQLVRTKLVLLLDADIELAAGTIDTLRSKLRAEQLALVSLMARICVSKPSGRSSFPQLLSSFLNFFIPSGWET